MMMKVERIYEYELDSDPKIIARKQRQFEKRLASHDELLSFLLNNLEQMQSELPDLKAAIARGTASRIREQQQLRARMEPRLWTLFRQRLQVRLKKHLQANALKQAS